MKNIFIFLCALVFLSGVAKAEIELYHFEKPHTQILFSVNHLGFSNSHGAFTDYDGSFEFNRSEPEKSKIDAVIKTDSAEMNDKAWNDAVRGKDYFNAAQFPQMTFKSTGVKVTGEKTAKIIGDLTLLGVTKPVTLDVTFNKADKHPFSGKYVAGFSAKGSLNRSDFGMKSGIPFVSDKVEIEIEVEGIRQGKGTENE
jgi:polyisoprenoid-binding protein YceI